MRKLAAVYERKCILFVMAAHRTKAGFWIDDGQVSSLKEPSPDELGAAVRAALARSQDGVETPPPTIKVDKPLLAAAGVRSWATFMKQSKHTTVSLEGNELKVTPYRNLGSRDGFKPLSDLAFPASSASAELGQKLLEVLGNST